jgi:superfamily II DNA or RNA helicase
VAKKQNATKKNDALMSSCVTGAFTPREWQSDAVAKVRSLAVSGADRALVYACPGSGKTYGGLLIASDLVVQARKGPKIIVLTPNLAIKTQWIDRALELGLRLLPVESGADLRQDSLGFEQTGFVMSYQQAVSMRHSLRQFCDATKPIVILDEVHHTAGPRADKDGNAWGHAVATSCASASFKLCTTGTPFREGNSPIAFVNYDDKQEAVACVSYTFEQAIKDRVCRPIEFPTLNGDFEWAYKGQKTSASFTDPLTKRKSGQRLNAALSVDGDFPRHLLELAHAKLCEIRRSGNSVDARAAGFAVAIDTEHANALANLLEKIAGKRPLVVHSKIDDAHAAIDAFRNSSEQWIVGVDMLSEGVDIPRLRVGVYASNVRTTLYFHQFCGRFARIIDPAANERSFVFMPADPELEAIALEIDKFRCHALGEEFTGKLQRVGGGRPSRVDLEVISSDGELAGTIVGGRRIPESYRLEMLPRIIEFRKKSPERAVMSDAECIAVGIDFGALPSIDEWQAKRQK